MEEWKRGKDHQRWKSERGNQGMQTAIVLVLVLDITAESMWVESGIDGREEGLEE